MTRKPHDIDVPDPHHRLSLAIDWELYAAMLEDSDLTLDQQKELIQTLWSLVVAFVDLGFDLNPVQQICGEGDDPLASDPEDVVSLIEKNLNTQQEEEA